MSIEEIPAGFQLMGLGAEPAVPAGERFIFWGLVWPHQDLLARQLLKPRDTDPQIASDALVWIRRVLKPEWIAADLDIRLAAARAIVSGQDAFLARYRLVAAMVQIIVTRSNVHITVAPFSPPPADSPAKLAEALLHLLLQVDQPAPFTDVPWTTTTIHGFTFGYQARTSPRDWRESISFLTNGRAVKFSMKEIAGRPAGEGPPKTRSGFTEEGERQWFDAPPLPPPPEK